jgi:mono/diheme cytochrome c family protein
MKKILKIVGILLAVLVLAVAALGLFVKQALPNVGAPTDLKVVSNPQRLARGQYLAQHVAVCAVCHSKRKEVFFGGPVYEDSLGVGGQLFGKTEGFPGNIYAPNLTPYHLGNWTDGELFRAITTGVSKDGHALFPLMNYPAYGKMDPEDIYSIIAYIRTFPSLSNEVPRTQLDFPISFIVNTIPLRASLASKPDTSNILAYGKYLVDMANCEECHSQAVKGKIVAGMEFGGGRSFPTVNGKTRYSANITPDKETGIGNWNQKLFVRKFKQYADSGYQPKPVTPMPWISYGGMEQKDLAAIYAYLQTVKPIHNVVIK